jgi:hypothetical protein
VQLANWFINMHTAKRKWNVKEKIL